jgi:outer membrane protein
MAQAEYRKLLYTRDSAKRNISIHVAKCYQEVLEWKKAVNAYRKAAAAARKWLIAAMADFDMGIGTAQNMLNAIEKHGENKSRYLEAALNYNISQAELIYATGVKDWQVCGKK